MQLVHGGDWAGYEAEYGAAPLDFSANVSPLGVPEGVQRAIAAAAAEADRYPDPLCRALRQAMGKAYHLPPEWDPLRQRRGGSDLEAGHSLATPSGVADGSCVFGI